MKSRRATAIKAGALLLSVAASLAQNPPAAGSSTAAVRITSSPERMVLSIDLTPCTTPCSFVWAAGSTHTISAPDQSAAAGTRYVFSRWSDGGPATHNIVFKGVSATIPGTPDETITNLAVTYDTQYFLSTSITPTGGTILPPSGWYTRGTSVPVVAKPSPGYQFNGFQGAVTSKVSPAVWVANRPATVTASFSVSNSTQPPPSGITSGPLPQALVLTPGVTGSINDPVYGQNRSWRIEFEIQNWTLPPAGQYGANIFILGGEGAYATLWPDGRLALTDFADQTASGGSPCFLPLANRTDVLVRYQKDLATKRLTCELWNSDGSGYANNSDTILATTGNTNLGYLGSPFTSVTLSFLRVATTLLGQNGAPPIKADSGDWTELKFNGNLTDSSGNGHSASLPNPVFLTLPAPLPLSLIRAAVSANWTGWITLRAGFPAQLDGSLSRASDGGVLQYSWQQVAGPTTLVWSSQSAAKPTIDGLIFGSYTVQLTVTDATGGQATSSMEFGAVATDGNGVVIYPHPALDILLGPSLAFGYNPWDWFDYRHAALSQFWTANYEVNGGGWRLETDLDTVDGVPRTGTAYASVGSQKVYGVGTNFKAVFCGGQVGPAVLTPGAEAGGTPFFVMKMPTGVPNEAPRLYPRAVQSCQSDTEITMADGWVWEKAQVNAPGLAWGTWNRCTTCGDWFGLLTQSNINYYGNDLANYALYYRSGMTTARDSARWLADRWYRSPWVLFGQTPRDFALSGTYIRAIADGGNPTYDVWPTLRAYSDYCVGPAGYLNNAPIIDVREASYCLGYVAMQALLDPDPVSRRTAQDRVVNAYNWQWGTQQTADGAYLDNEIEGDMSRSFKVTQGSATVTLNTGSAIPTDYCGVTYTSTGSIALSPDRVTITGQGTNFLGSAGKVIVLRGTLNGQPWSMTAEIASNPLPTSVSLTLVHPWRGDLTSVLPNQWRIYDRSIRDTSFYNMFFGKTNPDGSYPNPLAVDRDNWYWCTVVDGSTITLDKPYTGDTSGGNQYRRPSWRNLAGRGTQPFIMGIVGWAEYLASKSLEGYNDGVANGYRTAMLKALDWIWTSGRSPATKGLFYGVNYANCLSLGFVPAHECAAAAKDASNERSYNVESNGAFARKYLWTQSGTDLQRGNEYYTDQFARLGYNSPIPGDQYFAELIDPCCSFFNEKAYGQTFGIGQGHQWPAARLGGQLPASTSTWNLASGLQNVPGALSAVATVTSPSGAVSTVNCSSTTCSITADSRQGAPWVRITYSLAGGTTVDSQPVLLYPPPTTDSVSPNSGSGASQTFTFKYSSGKGTAYLDTVYALFNGNFSQAGGCSVYYVPASNTLYLLNDAGSGAAAGSPITPGAAGSTSNSQCTINGAALAAIANGNTLTLTVPVTFKPVVTALQNIFGYVTDKGGLNSGWQKMGTWKPPDATIFGNTAPASCTGIGSGTELGVKFTSDQAGQIRGIRFYKSPTDSTQHTGTLWSSAGVALATGTFANETASGWQTLFFASPVAITANTTYLASYHTNSSYCYTVYGFWPNGVDNPPLHALKDGGAGGYNGVYLPNSTGGVMPTYGFAASNFWVDVLFAATPPQATGSVTAVSGTPQSTSVGATFGAALKAKVLDTSSNPIAGVTVTFTAPASGASAAFNGSATATATTDVSGIATSPVPVANTTAGAYTATASVSGFSASFSLTNTALPPASVAAVGGTPQTTVISTAFGAALQAKVLNASSLPVSGVTVTFTAPGSGASATFSGSATATAVTDASGVARSPVPVANSTVGSYTVTASVSGVAQTASFSLSNTEVQSAPKIAVTVSPKTVTLVPSGTQTFTPTVTGTSNTAVTWSLSPNVGSMNGNTYTAPSAIASSQIVTLMAASQADPTKTDTASITLSPADTTIFGNSAPASCTGVGSGTELGVKFTSDVSGQIRGIRFYKNPTDSAQHTGTLWSSAGVALATGTFTNETASGWQTLFFASPVAITANTVYVASYHTNGSYCYTVYGFWPNGVDNPPLHALKDGGAGGYNGVYLPNSTGGVMPAYGFAASNFWADVLFAATPPQTVGSVTVVSGTPQSTSVGTAFGAALKAKVLDTSSNPIAGVTVTFTAPASGASAAFNGSATATATTDASGIATSPVPMANTTAGAYTVTASASGFSASFSLTNNALIPVSVTAVGGTPQTTAISTAFGAALQAKVVDASSLPVSGVTVTFTAPGSGASATFSGSATATAVTDASGVAKSPVPVANSTVGSYTVTASVSGVAQAASFSLSNASTPPAPITVTVSPKTVTLGASGTQAFTATVTGTGNTAVTWSLSPNVGTMSGNTYTAPSTIASAQVVTLTAASQADSTKTDTASITLTPPYTTIFAANSAPASCTGIGSGTELGVKFTSDAAGQIRGIRFYKSATDGTPHTGTLWSSTGVALATGTFTNETASGWQTLLFNSPVTIAANIVYVASYHTNGSYCATVYGFWPNGVDNPPLHALKDGASGYNGVYLPNTAGGVMPAYGYAASNFWVDVLFAATP